MAENNDRRPGSERGQSKMAGFVLRMEIVARNVGTLFSVCPSLAVWEMKIGALEVKEGPLLSCG